MGLLSPRLHLSPLTNSYEWKGQNKQINDILTLYDDITVQIDSLKSESVLQTEIDEAL